MQSATARQVNPNERSSRSTQAPAEFDLKAAVRAAANAVAPLWPIATFAARSPWMGLESLTFDEIARRMRLTHGVELYPDASKARNARERGEVDPAQLEKGLQRWLDVQAPVIPRPIAEAFCRKALEHDRRPEEISPEVQALAERMNALAPECPEMQAVQTKSRQLERKSGVQAARQLDHQLITWCKLYLDTAQASWSMPGRDKGFYRAWRLLAPQDPALGREARRVLKDWPLAAEAALLQALTMLEIPEQEIRDYLEAHLLALPGWAGMLRWRSAQSAKEKSLLTEYLAVRMTLEWALLAQHLPIKTEMEKDGPGRRSALLAPLIDAWVKWGDMTVVDWMKCSAAERQARLTLAARFDQPTRNRLWLEAWERTYASRLQRKLERKEQLRQPANATAQFVFCIDVRSEPIRRRLEQAGPFETFGMAGFFGLPIATQALGSSRRHPSLPVILDPQQLVQEKAEPAKQAAYEERRGVEQTVGLTFKTMKQHLLAGMLLPEASGPWLGLAMLGRSLFPRSAGRLMRKAREGWRRKPQTTLTLDHDHDAPGALPIGLTEAEQAGYVHQALRSMGLTANFAPLVVICGHGSQSTNNPYAAKLDCGACGGAAGGFNARVLATLANQPQVRARLAEAGLAIPAGTVFSAAEHNTTLDELRWVYLPTLSEKALEAYLQVVSVLPAIRSDALADRLSRLPQLNRTIADPIAEAERLAEDWSEVRPEWGLARNAAFIVGRRELTRGCDLEGRVFLHNYDWQADEDGSLLAAIIGGPAAVGQWINLQYYASTVAPHFYGSGSKATQTVTAGLGVMQGNASDLMTGLPWQSVMRSEGEAYHAPLRLLLVIEAPRAHIERLLAQDAVLRQKVSNGWLHLSTVDPHGRWEAWTL